MWTSHYYINETASSSGGVVAYERKVISKIENIEAEGSINQLTSKQEINNLSNQSEILNNPSTGCIANLKSIGTIK